MLYHIAKEDYSVARWSGGETREFFIWPRDSAYAKRDFAFRISSATVELEKSTFTPLPDYMRHITPLTGGFTLTFTHDGACSEKTLKPLEFAYFSGAWTTECLGRATDFNLMVRRGALSRMEVREAGELDAPYRGAWFVYALEDTKLGFGKEGISLSAGELEVAIGEGGAVFTDRKVIYGEAGGVTANE